MWCSGGTMGFWGWTVMIALWGGLAGLVFWAVRSGVGGASRPAPSALEILQRRFAAGEIPREEYEERRRLLEST